jgi:hypothetical protein
MKRMASLSSALALSMAASTASASVFVLDFTGVADPSVQTTVGGFYNGGTSGDGNSGTNYGAAFPSSAVASNIDLGEPDAQPGVLLVGISPHDVVINVAAGFDTGFAVNFITNFSASFEVFDGLGATGTSLGSRSLTDGGCNFCAWAPAGIAFAGVAKSVRLMDGGNGAAFDDLTFGASRPGSAAGGAVPEPETWALMIGGLGIAGGELRRRRRRDAAAQSA